MTPISQSKKRAQMRSLIEKRVIFRKEDGAAIVHNGEKMDWIFDFRRVILDPAFIDLAADLFWERFAPAYPFQVGGLESAAIPLVAAIVMRGIERGTPVTGFYIRKSRKPEGLQKIIEGELTRDPIILVDDLINKGGSFVKQIEILKREADRKPASVFAFVRFRELGSYDFLNREGILLDAVFALDDFGLELKHPTPPPDTNAFEVVWGVRTSASPNYFHRVMKSGPVLGNGRVYIGSDDGIMHALAQGSGEEVWQFKILGLGTAKKVAFSTPVFHDNLIYFGAYDGNFYALDAATGKMQWMYMDADWIGSSPVVASDLGLVYVGLEYGLWKRHGGVAALDTNTGKKRWEYIAISGHANTPTAYSKKHGIVVVSASDGAVHCLRASSGELLWEHTMDAGEVGPPVIDEKRAQVILGVGGGSIGIIDIRDGALIRTVATGSGIGVSSKPCIQDNCAYLASPDKRVYCLDLDTLELVWTFATEGRIFASPIVVNRQVYVGSNDGRFYVLDADTGHNTDYFQTSERITSTIAYDENTKKFFLPTYANEIYCLARRALTSHNEARYTRAHATFEEAQTA